MTCWKYRRWVATWVFGKRRSCTLEIHQKRRCDVLSSYNAEDACTFQQKLVSLRRSNYLNRLVHIEYQILGNIEWLLRSSRSYLVDPFCTHETKFFENLHVLQNTRQYFTYGNTLHVTISCYGKFHPTILFWENDRDIDTDIWVVRYFVEITWQKISFDYCDRDYWTVFIYDAYVFRVYNIIYYQGERG